MIHPTFPRCRLVAGTHPHGIVHFGTLVRAIGAKAAPPRACRWRTASGHAGPRGGNTKTFENIGVPKRLNLPRKQNKSNSAVNFRSWSPRRHNHFARGRRISFSLLLSLSHNMPNSGTNSQVRPHRLSSRDVVSSRPTGTGLMFFFSIPAGQPLQHSRRKQQQLGFFVPLQQPRPFVLLQER